MIRARSNRRPLDPHCRAATREELGAGSGWDVFAELRAVGADGGGTKEAVYGDTKKFRSHLCAAFPRERVLVPAVVCVFTTILPLHRGREG